MSSIAFLEVTSIKQFSYLFHTFANQKRHKSCPTIFYDVNSPEKIRRQNSWFSMKNTNRLNFSKNLLVALGTANKITGNSCTTHRMLFGITWHGTKCSDIAHKLWDKMQCWQIEGQDNMTAILPTTFSNRLGWDKRLVPCRRQAIIWTNGDISNQCMSLGLKVLNSYISSQALHWCLKTRIVRMLFTDSNMKKITTLWYKSRVNLH